ncbi:DUF1742-domain-containing protein [Lactarius vividus]|nr:DUF1742-domain-containing protein [Lactarius vividus]
MSFQNIYFKRATATSRACYVCSKPTATCLATTNAVDFIYTCDAHLSDPGFATEIVDPNAPKEVVVSKEEIARVKAEWEAKEEARKKKDNKGKAPSGDKGGEATEGGAGEKKDDDGKKKSSDKSPSPSSSVPGSLPSTPAVPATPTHKRYSLHRDFYAMRQAEHRRRRQAKQMQELAPRLPGAPRGTPIG